jgi:hypothetical protein
MNLLIVLPAFEDINNSNLFFYLYKFLMDKKILVPKNEDFLAVLPKSEPLFISV